MLRLDLGTAEKLCHQLFLLSPEIPPPECEPSDRPDRRALCIYGHDSSFFPDHQAQQFQLLHDDLPCIRQQQLVEGYRGSDLHRRVAKVTELEREELPC